MLPLLPILSWVINLTGAINISLLEAEQLMFEKDRVQIVVNEITGKVIRIHMHKRVKGYDRCIFKD